jgi:hypothetical protein
MDWKARVNRGGGGTMNLSQRKRVPLDTAREQHLTLMDMP